MKGLTEIIVIILVLTMSIPVAPHWDNGNAAPRAIRGFDLCKKTLPIVPSPIDVPCVMISFFSMPFILDVIDIGGTFNRGIYLLLSLRTDKPPRV